MANSNIPGGLANQVSSESLDTFLLNLSAPSDIEDLAMDPASDDDNKSHHPNVKQPPTMPSTLAVDSVPRENTNIDTTTTRKGVLNHNASNGIMPSSNAGVAPTASVPAPSESSQSAATAVSAAQAISGTVPEFLYQLFKMLTDNNREVIEWADGKFATSTFLRLKPLPIINRQDQSPFPQSTTKRGSPQLFPSFQVCLVPKATQLLWIPKAGWQGENVTMFIRK